MQAGGHRFDPGTLHPPGLARRGLYDHGMAPAPTGERIAHAAGLWSRSLAIDVAALAACRYLLGGFEIHGVAAYLVAAVGIELPTVVWWLAVQLLLAKGFDERFIDSPFVLRLVWIAAVFALALAVPIALATSAPGLAVAAWISSLQITGAATFVGACAITSLLTIGLRQSRPLRFARAFLKGDPELRRSPVRSPYAP